MKNPFFVPVPYTGATPGADSATYTLFSTVTKFPGKYYCASDCLPRLVLSLQNSQAGTLKGYRSNDRGVTWVQVFPDTAIAAAAAGSINFYDFFIAEYADFKLDWTNGGNAQATWNIDMALAPHQVTVT